MAGSFSSFSFRFFGTLLPLTTVKVEPEPEETSELLRHRGGNLVINKGRRQPSSPRSHLRLVRPKKEPATPPMVVKQEHTKMAADLDTGLKWSRDDYVCEEMERQRGDRRTAPLLRRGWRHRARRQRRGDADVDRLRLQ
ncbi:hypothetical protein D1007_39530 [Hordeum vulgare]|nr:hypothetical protein D1007_39530 [Hordeum vulgare]